MSYDIEKTDYDRYLLIRLRDFFIIDSSEKQGPLIALRSDIMRRLERAHNAKVPIVPRAHAKRQEARSNVEMPTVRA